MKRRGFLKSWYFWLFLITGIAIIVRSLPAWMNAAWGVGRDVQLLPSALHLLRPWSLDHRGRPSLGDAEDRTDIRGSYRFYLLLHRLRSYQTTGPCVALSSLPRGHPLPCVSDQPCSAPHHGAFLHDAVLLPLHEIDGSEKISHPVDDLHGATHHVASSDHLFLPHHHLLHCRHQKHAG